MLRYPCKENLILIESRGILQFRVFFAFLFFLCSFYFSTRTYTFNTACGIACTRAARPLIRAIHKRPLDESPFILAHSSADRPQARRRRQSEVARFRTLIFACARACNPLRSNRWVIVNTKRPIGTSFVSWLLSICNRTRRESFY